jgi:8-oxo-dGTP diphosphatase
VQTEIGKLIQGSLSLVSFSINLNPAKTVSMKSPTIQTLTFIFDNKTDHILLQRITTDGPLKGKHSGIKGEPGLLEDMNEASVRTIRESTGLEISNVVLRGVVKVIQEETEAAVLWFVYESSRFSGELQNKPGAQLKWVDILHIFNLEMESLVQELMPYLLDGESFFEGTIYLNNRDEVSRTEIRICNSI